MANKATKVGVVGIDGANTSILELLDSKRQMSDLISTIPPYTPPSWTSIITGVNPGKHKIFAWRVFDPDMHKTRLLNSHDVGYSRVFELLNLAKIQNIIINLPMTYPFTGIKNKQHSIIVSDWAAPKQDIYPSSLFDKYQEFLIDPPHTWRSYEEITEYIKIIDEFLSLRLDMYYDLLESRNWNFYFIVFSEVDWILHKMPELLEHKNVHLVKPILKKIQKFINSIEEYSDIVFIVSDHGFEAKDRVLYINEILKNAGFIRPSRVQGKIISWIKNKIPLKLRKKIKYKLNFQSFLEYESDVLKSDAFMIDPESWGVYVQRNIEKIVPLFKNTEGIREVILREDVYSGNYLKYAPYLILVPEPGVDYSTEFSGKIFGSVTKGDHELHGVFSVKGQHIKEHIPYLKTPTVYDVTPTILHIFGLPVSNDMDGRVLMEIFEEDSEFAKRKPKYVDPSYYGKKREDEKLKKAIKNLKFKGKV